MSVDITRPIKIYWAVVVRYGRSVEDGFLPVMSVDTEEEAQRLLTLGCQTNYDNEYIARELVDEQTLDNLKAFGERLHNLYHQYIKAKEKI